MEKGKTQRRPGLHVEKPHSKPATADLYESMFGGSYLDGGIFMASNLDSTCRIWNAQVESRAIGWEGDVEYLRDHLDDVCVQNTSHTPRCRVTKSKILTKANTIYWITDKTPHEAVPVLSSGKRQFFRLVVGPLSTWHAAHNTANPNGIKPPKSCKIVKFDKFGKKKVDDDHHAEKRKIKKKLRQIERLKSMKAELLNEAEKKKISLEKELLKRLHTLEQGV